jgi:hypothetical protein
MGRSGRPQRRFVSLPLVSITSRMNPIHIIPAYCFMIHLILSSYLRVSCIIVMIFISFTLISRCENTRYIAFCRIRNIQQCPGSLLPPSNLFPCTFGCKIDCMSWCMRTSAKTEIQICRFSEMEMFRFLIKSS